MTLTALFATLLLAIAPARTYTNPVLFSDYSDPDLIRVGEDYWMTASSFTCFPGCRSCTPRTSWTGSS